MGWGRAICPGLGRPPVTGVCAATFPPPGLAPPAAAVLTVRAGPSQSLASSTDRSQHAHGQQREADPTTFRAGLPVSRLLYRLLPSPEADLPPSCQLPAEQLGQGHGLGPLNPCVAEAHLPPRLAGLFPVPCSCLAAFLGSLSGPSKQ